MNLQSSHSLAVGLALNLAMAGCSLRVDAPRAADSQAIPKEVGPHGGMVAEVGPSAHAEIVCEDGAILDIYLLGEDIKTPLSVNSAIMEGFGVVSGQGPLPTRLTFTRTNDAEGNHFQTSLPAEWSGKRAAVVCPKVVIAGQRWHLDFEIDIPQTARLTESARPATNDEMLPADICPSETK